MGEERYKSQSAIRMESVLRELGSTREVYAGADTQYIILDTFERLLARIKAIESKIKEQE